MHEISFQKRNGLAYPFSEEDAEKWASYRDNQIIRCKCTGAQRPRSYRQLKTYYAGCREVAENTESGPWSTKEGVDFQLRVALDFRDTSKVAVRPDGTVQFFYRSISYENLNHIEACNYFSRAFELMANKLGCTVDELMNAIIVRCGG